MMRDDTADRMRKIEAIRRACEEAHGGPTTIWAVRNEVKRLLQQWGVSSFATIRDSGSKSFTLFLDHHRVERKLHGNDNVLSSFWKSIEDAAHKCGYEISFAGGPLEFTQIP